MKKSANSHLQKPRITESHHPTSQTSATGLDELQTTSRWLHQNGTEVKHSLETQIPIGATFITIGIQRSQCRPNSSTDTTQDHSQNQVQFREINIIPHKNIDSVMNFFETYEFSHQLTTRSSRKPISSPRRHNRTQTVCDLALLQEPSLSLKSYMGKLSISLGHVNWYTDTRLLSFCQLLRWELLVGGDCIFHIIGIAHDKSSWLLDDFLQSFMKAHGPLKISAIGNWSVFLQCQMTFCAAIVPNTKCTSVKLSKANTIQLFFFVCVLYIKRTRFSGEIELRYLIGKTLMEPLSYASSE
ncbi:hypothetical protein Bca4012_092068 [Brassica carinata]|uniref:Uncharacterized protein n=1 Tax=Brassica carinata TaxID=52824 RepID=A0A8X7PR96_BRACI|nr:hypothetical protein Bca52824_074537 [Brassica carinata]